MPARHDPLIGAEIDNRFTITHRLGVGGMGAVYAAVQHSIGRRVAIKVVHPELTCKRSIARRFLRECFLASRLHSPYIAAVHDSGQTDSGLLYMVMELIDGHTLGDELRHSGALSPGRAVQIAVGICRALETAHAAGVVHRDLKPANIMLGGRGDEDSVVVLDFGLARSFLSSADKVTEAGTLIGTSRYIAPELIRGEPPAPTSDLYSLGAVLYTMLAGRAPFVGDEVAVLRCQVLTPAPRLEAPVPAALADVVARLLDKRPEHRFATAGEVREALVLALSTPEPALDPTPPPLPLAFLPSPRPTEPLPAPALPPRRRGRVVALTAAITALVVAVIVSTGLGALHRRSPGRVSPDAESLSVPRDRLSGFGPRLQQGLELQRAGPAEHRDPTDLPSR